MGLPLRDWDSSIDWTFSLLVGSFIKPDTLHETQPNLQKLGWGVCTAHVFLVPTTAGAPGCGRGRRRQAAILVGDHQAPVRKRRIFCSAAIDPIPVPLYTKIVSHRRRPGGLSASARGPAVVPTRGSSMHQIRLLLGTGKSNPFDLLSFCFSFCAISSRNRG